MSNKRNPRRGGPGRRSEAPREAPKRTKSMDEVLAALIRARVAEREKEKLAEEHRHWPDWAKRLGLRGSWRNSSREQRRYWKLMRRFRREVLGYRGMNAPCPTCKQYGHVDCNPEVGAGIGPARSRTGRAGSLSRYGAWRRRGGSSDGGLATKRWQTVPGRPQPTEEGQRFFTEHATQLCLYIELQQPTWTATMWAMQKETIDEYVEHFLRIVDVTLSRRDRQWLLYQLPFHFDRTFDT